MVKKSFIYSFILLTVLVIAGCAQINPLLGGSKDKFSPSIDSAGTYPQNGQINFKEDRVVIKFNEYIILNKPNDNIIITPQLDTPPDISAKNKKLTIVFQEPLDDSTTYTISFNHAIRDITEKNDSVFQYVFSTGTYIDSLNVTGRITDAFTNQPNEGFLVGLYGVNTETEFDSIPANDRPIYIAQTNQSGNFIMNYLKAGEYYIFAIDDQNKNLKLDPSEKRSFLQSEKITVGIANKSTNLYSYKPEVAEVKIKSTQFIYPGKVEFVLSNEPTTFEVYSSMELLQEDTERKDSLVYWLGENPASKMSFIVSLNSEIDTIKPLYKGIPDLKDLPSLDFTNNLLGKKLLPNRQFQLIVSEPISAIDSNAIHFLRVDSSEVEKIAFEIKNVRTIEFDSLQEEIKFLRIDSGAVVSNFAHINQKAYWESITVLQNDYFGTLILNIDSLFNQAVFVDLLNDKSEVIRSVPFEKQLLFEALIPGKYQVRLVFDDNEDGKWTTGFMKEKRNPERVLYNKELIDIKSRWEKEVDWIIQN